MEFVDSKEISYCTLFLLEVSQDELEVYESCLQYVFAQCSDSAIYEIAGCTREELNGFSNCI